MTDTEKTLTAIVKAVESLTDTTVTAVHLNDGGSEYYIQGFNDGYDDAEANIAPYYDTMPAPPSQAMLDAYQRGYDQGYAWFTEHVAH